MPIFIILYLLLPLIHVSPLPSPTLLALNCTPTSHQSLVNNITIESLLNNLTNVAQKTHYATLKTNQFTGLIQCRLDLNQPNCFFCIKYAKTTIFRLCPNSRFLMAWFDGCYVGYSLNNSTQIGVTTTTKVSNKYSCSSNNQSYTATGNGRIYAQQYTPVIKKMDRAHFEASLETLLLSLKAEATAIETHHRFSYGELSYGNNNGHKIYAIVECIRNLSPKQCDSCLGQGMEILQKQCGGNLGGNVVVEGQCLVWFEIYKFFYDIPPHHGGLKSISLGKMENSDGNNSNNIGHVLKREYLLLWGIVVAFITAVGICGCLLRRSIINRAKVVAVSGVEDDKL